MKEHVPSKYNPNPVTDEIIIPGGGINCYHCLKMNMSSNVSKYLCLCPLMSVSVALPQTSFHLQWISINGDNHDRSK